MKRWGLTWRLAAAGAIVACLAIPEILRRRETATGPAPAPAVVRASGDCLADRAPPTVGSPNRYFTDITDELGIDFEHVVGPLGTFFQPEVNGTGGAFFDADGDGDLDLLLVNGGRSPATTGDLPATPDPSTRFYLRGADGRFHDATSESGLVDRGFGVACAVGDIDNDGDLDVYLTKYGPDRLFENDGQGKFRDISAAAGIDNPEYTTAAAFFDYDRDGRLDLIAVNYTSDPVYRHSVGCGFPDGRVSYCGPLKFAPTVDRLYHNDGVEPGPDGRPHVRFRDVTDSSGLAQASTYGLGVLCGDVDEDGWPDIFVANDMQPNRLWINQRNGTFREEGMLRGVGVSGQGRPQAGMGAATADLDGDGRLDLISTHMSTEYTTYYHNEGQGTFSDQSGPAQLIGSTSRHTGWGIVAADFDHDGWIDLAIGNGLVVPCHLHFAPHGEEEFQVGRRPIADSRAFWRDYHDQNLLLLNDGHGRWNDASDRGGDFVALPGSARAVLSADIDDDGDLDLLVTYCGQRARLFRNDVPKRGHWLLVRAIDPRLRRDACGAVIVVSAGGRRFQQIAQTSGSYLAVNDSRVHFGLGSADHFDQLIVNWPDGSSETFAGAEADRSIVLERGTGVLIERSAQ